MLEVACPFCESHDARPELAWREYWLVRCRRCDLVYSDHLDVPATLYDEAAEHHPAYRAWLEQGKEAAERSFYVPWAWNRFLRFARSAGRAGGQILDVGCAGGAFLVVAKKRGWSPHGVDLSLAAAQAAREVTRGDVRQGTLESCCFAPASFDAITAWEVLEHLPRPKDFIAEVFRTLRPGGVLGMSVPNWNSIWERTTQEDQKRPPYHLTYWSAGPLAQLLSQAGFVHVQTREKPIAWSEVGRWKWVYLPVAIARSIALRQRGDRLMVLARKPLYV